MPSPIPTEPRQHPPRGQPSLPEKAAVVRVRPDGKTATFDPEKDLIDFPGGSKKFTIRKDPAGPGYWTLASIIPDRHAGQGVPPRRPQHPRPPPQ
jgi:hypothetical protein